MVNNEGVASHARPVEVMVLEMTTINGFNLTLLEYLEHDQLLNADLVEPLIRLVVLSLVIGHLQLLHSIVREEQALALFLHL